MTATGHASALLAIDHSRRFSTKVPPLYDSGLGRYGMAMPEMI